MMARVQLTSLLLMLLATPVPGAVVGEPKKPYADRDDDIPREHVEEIADGRREYTIEFRGTVDGTMTRTPIGYGAFRQGWQPNRSVLIENVGETDVVNPRLIVNGQRDWQTLESIVSEATRGCESEAEKARAIWEFVRRQRFHACTWDGECSDALKALNVYGYTLCGNQAQVITDLWRAAGLKTRRCYPIGHCVSEVLYGGRYHLMDSDEHVICLLRDNRTLASAEEIVRDHDLVKRTHTYGIGRSDGRQTDEFSASLYVHEGKRKGTYGVAARHSMDLTLRPGESIELRWDHIGKQYSSGTALEPGQRKRDGLGDLLAGWGTTAYDNMRNGKLRYRPDLGSPLSRSGTETVDNITFDLKADGLTVTDTEQPGVVTWRFSSPYVFVGGQASASAEGGEGSVAEWRWSTDGKSWKTVATIRGGETRPLIASLDKAVSPRGQPTYTFWLQLSMRGNVVVREVAFENDIQTSALSLPELTVGDNRVVFTDSSPGPRNVRIAHRWLERNAWRAPYPPAEAVAPQDGATVEGTQVRFAWSQATDSDGAALVDYHFELSAHADMRWPLSPNFEKRISLTPFKGKTQWTAPYVGLLNPDTTYYWRVRGLDANGVWSPWSRTFRFQTLAPGVPLDVKLRPDEQGGLTLAWRPNPQGKTPADYKIYGSNEKGFSVSDNEYVVFRAKGFVRSIEEYADKAADTPDAGSVKTLSNLIARTAEAELRVVGPGIDLPNTNRAFYRVVAIDEAGIESGPSDYAEVPRPFVFTRPPIAKHGKPYRYQPDVIRSIGDLRCRRSPKSSYNAAFWDREQLMFEAVRLPPGLSQDPCSGLISGVPAQAGQYEMVFEIDADPGETRTVSQGLRVEK